MVKYYFYLFISSMVMSCLKDDNLGLNLTDNQSSSLKMDGVYLLEDSLGVVDLYYFYQNGTLLSRGSVIKKDLETKLNALSNPTNENYKNIKFLWGVYQIENKQIKFERWYPSDIPYKALIKEGEILNDTTFIINKAYKSNGQELKILNEMYRFRKMSIKPDSINAFTVKQ
jgi:hypothetical protein